MIPTDCVQNIGAEIEELQSGPYNTLKIIFSKAISNRSQFLKNIFCIISRGEQYRSVLQEGTGEWISFLIEWSINHCKFNLHNLHNL